LDTNYGKTSLLLEFMNYQSITRRCGQLWWRVKAIQRNVSQRSSSIAAIDASPVIMNTKILSVLSLSIVTVNSSITCDTVRYSSGCEDHIGSFCNQTTNQCECKAEYTVDVLNGRFCLKSRNLSESCIISDQCVNNSRCFSNNTELLSSKVQYWIRPEVPLFPEGKCVCPNNYFLNTFNVCQPKKSIEETCSQDNQCRQPYSVCNSTTNKCSCDHSYVYSTIIGHCVKGKYLGQGCTGREECQYSELHSWCIDGICLCGAGYTPEPSFNGMPQCVLETLLVEKVDPTRMHGKIDSSFDYVMLLLMITFITAFIIAIFIARRNRNSIMQMIRPSNDLNRTFCDQSHVVMIPIDNSINSFNNDRDNCKLNP